MTNTQNSIIRFKNVDFRYGDGQTILQNVNLNIEKGSFYFLTGRSGAGKSSLLKLLYLGARPSNGHAYIFGRDTKSYSRSETALARQNISVVFQDYKLLPHLNAFENVALPLRIKGEKESIINKKVKELLIWVGLELYMHAFPETLSGGQQQRISIARSVITSPKIILADEPTGSVDDSTALKIMTLFEQLHEHGTTIIMATHNRGLVNSKNHPELFIDNGTIYKRQK